MHLVLKYLLQLRLVLIMAELLGLLVVGFGFNIPLAWPVIGGVLGIMAAYSAWSWQRWRGVRDVPAAEFLRQTFADLCALTVLIYLTGGPVNPFISLFLLPIVFAAATLSLRLTTLVALLAVGGYTLLMFFYHPLLDHAHALHGADLHLWGMWYGFLVSAGCVALFVARIGQSLRQRDQALAQAREQALESERAIALGTLAAGTAHELGTPLATIAILAKDLESDLADNPLHRSALATLRQQVERCKQSLANLAADAGALPADSGSLVTVEVFLRGLLEDWKQSRATIAIEVNWKGTGGPVAIVADRSLQQALSTVLNNAAEACLARVEVTAGWDAESMSLCVRDDGPGLEDGLRARLGREVVSTKGERGLGLGLYLAHSVLRRLGGTVEFVAQATRGTEVLIRVPLQGLQAQAG